MNGFFPPIKQQQACGQISLAFYHQRLHDHCFHKLRNGAVEAVYHPECMATSLQVEKRTIFRWMATPAQHWKTKKKKANYKGKIHLQQHFENFVHENRYANGRTKAKVRFWIRSDIKKITTTKRKSTGDSLEEHFADYLKKRKISKSLSSIE